MPCPPTWEELELMRIDRDRDESRRQLAKTEPELLPALAVVEALRDQDPAATLGDLEPCLDFARRWRERGGPTIENTAIQGDDIGAAVARAEAEASALGEAARKIPFCLCVFRTFIARFVRDHDVPEELLADISREQARHLQHREAERRERITELEAQLVATTHQIDELPPQLDGDLRKALVDGIRGRIAEKEQHLRRIRDLDAATLCTDRCALD